MGPEAGQPLEAILRRKELERAAGNGVFAWGIGNSLGKAPIEARHAVPNGEIEVLFTRLKSAPKASDLSPAKLLLWLCYFDEAGRPRPLPEHALVTSRGDENKRSHYALICRSEEEICGSGALGVIDAACARNLRTYNPVGASQVTAIVRYCCDAPHSPERLYDVSFRARLEGQGFVRLAAPVALTGLLRRLYEDACSAASVAEWRIRVSALKDAAREHFERACFNTSRLFA